MYKSKKFVQAIYFLHQNNDSLMKLPQKEAHGIRQSD